MSERESCTSLLGKTIVLMLETCGETRKHRLYYQNVFEFAGKHFCFMVGKFARRLKNDSFMRCQTILLSLQYRDGPRFEISKPYQAL